MRIHILLPLFLLIPWGTQAQVTVTLGEQQEQIYPLAPNAVDSLADVAPIARLAANARVVSMGEATHGTKEFFNTKAKVFKQLVLEHGFRTFILEASVADCALVDEALNGSDSAATRALDYLSFWTWHTAEVNDLLAWIRRYNKDRPAAERIRFMGCDMQNARAVMYYVDRVLKRSVPDGLVEWDQLYALSRQKPVPRADSEEQRVLTQAAYNWLGAHEDLYMPNLDPEGRWMMKFCRKNLHQTLDFAQRGGAYRDSCMAANILAIDSVREGGLFVWAHNGHVMRDRGNTWQDYGKRMGCWLSDAYGQDLYVIGFAFHEGCFTVRNAEHIDMGNKDSMKQMGRAAVRSACVERAPKRSVTTELAAAGPPAFFVSLRGTTNPLFTKELRMWDIGALFSGSDTALSLHRVARDFDALIFVATSTPSVQLSR